MVRELLLSIIPLSIGAAFSPTVLGFTLLILSGKLAPRERVVFMVLGMFIVLIILASIAGVATNISKNEAFRHFLKLLDLVFALILLYLGIRSLTRRQTDKGTGSPLARKNHGNLKPVSFVAIGFAVMLTDISSIVLFVPAIRDIGLSHVSSVTKLLFAVVPFVGVLTPALLPLFAEMISPETAGKALNAVNGWMSRHNRIMSAGVSFLFCAFLLWKGLGG